MRSARARLVRFLSAWLFVAVAPMAAQQPSQSPNGTAEPSSDVRIEILGASVSAGFVDSPLTGGSKDNASAPLLVPFRRWLEEADAQVKSRADLMMFVDPIDRGRLQVDRAVRQKPGMVVAVDFLFWYGYGAVDGPETAATDARLARLRVGLETLDRLQCPIVVGDFPDMRGADRRMLQPHQIPSPAALVALNDEVRAWSKTRPRVRVFGLAELVAQMKEKGVRLPAGDYEVPTKPMALLQKDRLHANRLGVAYLAFVLHHEVRAAVAEDVRDRIPETSFVSFCTFAGAEDDLAEQDANREPQKPKAAEPAKSDR